MANLQITIDDGPEPVADALDPILEELKTRGVKAAFFVLGREVRTSPAAVEKIRQRGHVLGNHSWDHFEPSTSKYSNAQILAQFERTHKEVETQTTIKMQHWRAPRLDQWDRIERILTTGASPVYTLTHCDWQADSWDAGRPKPAKTAAQMLENIRAGIALKPGRKYYRLLFHVVPHTAIALPEILTELTLKDGHTLVDFAQTAPVIVRPATQEVQLIAGIIYATMSGKTDAERAAIGATVANRAHHARCVNKPGGGACGNSIFGNGTILDALKKGFAAYDDKATPGNPWNEVMNKGVMRPKNELDVLPEAKRFRLESSITAAESLNLASTPINVAAVGGAPVAFNQAGNSPPSPRMKRIGSAGKHTFYGFKPGRECA